MAPVDDELHCGDELEEPEPTRELPVSRRLMLGQSSGDNYCDYCGTIHVGPGICPRISAIEYHPTGSIKRIELR